MASQPNRKAISVFVDASNHLTHRLSESSAHFVVAADVEQDDFVLGDAKDQCQAIGVGDADGVETSQFPFEWVQPQVRLKRVSFQVHEDAREP
jgi:hypothetical protein